MPNPGGSVLAFPFSLLSVLAVIATQVPPTLDNVPGAHPLSIAGPQPTVCIGRIAEKQGQVLAADRGRAHTKVDRDPVDRLPFQRWTDFVFTDVDKYEAVRLEAIRGVFCLEASSFLLFLRFHFQIGF